MKGRGKRNEQQTQPNKKKKKQATHPKMPPPLGISDLCLGLSVSLLSQKNLRKGAEKSSHKDQACRREPLANMRPPGKQVLNRRMKKRRRKEKININTHPPPSDIQETHAILIPDFLPVSVSLWREGDDE